MKAFVTSKPEAAATYLAERYKRVVVRRQRFWRPVVWFRPNLLKDLPCFWHWDSTRRESQKEKWDDRGGVLFYYPSFMNERGFACDAHYHEQCPTSLKLFVLHTAMVHHESVIPKPSSWDHLRRSISLRFPNRQIVESAYDRIRAQRCDVSDVRSCAVCRECEVDPRHAAINTRFSLAELVGVEPRDSGGIIRSLFGFRHPQSVFPIMTRIRPFDAGPDRDFFDFVDRWPAAEDGWRYITRRHLSEAHSHFRAMLYALSREGHVLVDPIMHVYDFEAMNPDFGQIEEISREKARLLESMIRFVESLPELPLSS